MTGNHQALTERGPWGQNRYKPFRGCMIGGVIINSLMNSLIMMLDALLKDLEVNNPCYETAFDIADNPVISTVSQVLGRNPMYFAEPVNGGELVRFDMEKIRKLREEIANL